MRWLPTTLIVAAAVGCNALAAAELDIHLVWGGYTRSGAATELQFAPDSGSPGMVELRVFGATPPIAIDMTGHKQGSSQITVPLFIRDASQPLKMSSATEAADSLQQEIPLHEVPSDHVLVAVAIASPGEFANVSPSPDNVTTIAASASDLPSLSIAYHQLDGLVVDEATLSQLSNKQLGALESFLARCGSVAGFQITSAVLVSLRETAGCEGNMVQALAEPEQIKAWLGRVIRAPQLPPLPPALPSAVESGAGISQASFLLGFFFTAILFVTLFFRRVVGAIAVSAIATGLMLVHGGDESHAMHMTSVLDVIAGASRGTLVATTQQAGLHRGIAELGLPQDSVVVESKGDATVTAHVGNDNPRLMFTVLTAINSLAAVSFVVDVKVPDMPTLFSDGTQFGVRNTSTTSLRDATLFMNGIGYIVPELKPAQEWIWSASAKAAQVPAWLQHRISTGQTALVLPYDPTTLMPASHNNVDSTSWALIKMVGAT